MNIYEEVTMYTKPKNLTRDLPINDLVQEWNAYSTGLLDKDLDPDRMFEEDSNIKFTKDVEEISPYDLMSDNEEIYANLDMSDWNVCEKISFFAKKEIDDNLSLDEQKEEIEDFHKKITKKFENLKDNSWNQDYDYVFENKPIEKEKLPNWAIMKLHDYQEAVSIQMVKSAKDGNFKWVLDAISGGKEVSYGPFSSEDSLELMKAAIKNHGADNQFLKSMAKMITRCNSEDQEFTKKLLKETLKTEEYKKAAKEILPNNKKSKKNVGR